MSPVDTISWIGGDPDRVDDFDSAQVVVSFGAEPAKQELSGFVESPHLFPLSYQVHIGPSFGGHECEVFLFSLAGFQFKATGFTVGVNSVYISFLDYGSGDTAMERIGVSLIGPVTMVGYFGGSGLLIQFNQV